jgi:ATP/maltotriose-dependent transcriptional regulator MalT
MAESGLADSAAWVPVQDGERDPQRFWIMVADALRDTIAGSKLVRPLTGAPDLDGWTVVERLLEDLEPLGDPLWLVIDDAHELRSVEALAQLELLVMRGPAELRLVLVTRRDVRLGLHRLRLEGQLTEIRAADLPFTVDEARTLFEAAGVELPESALAALVRRTEGWAAGLRLAALSLAGHPDPERFAAEFSGSERTVAEYLLAEVLDHHPEPVRRLLLHTSVCERISGELADVLTGGSGGERILQDLEDAGAFVVSLDGRRSWFRYHPLFADLLQLELRRTESAELAALHDAAARWYAEHGYPVEAVRQAQAAQDWGLAARLLSDHFLGLALTGQGTTAHELLARFPVGVVAADPKLAVLLAADELLRRSLNAAERHLARAEREIMLVFHEARGMLELARGRDADALATFQAAGQLAGFLVTAHPRPTPMQAHMLHTLVRLGETERVEQVVAGLDHPGRGETRTALAALRVAQGDPEAAAAALAPVLDGSAPVTNLGWMTQAFVLEAIAREALGNQAAARHALEHALDLAEPDGAVFAFVLHPAPELRQRHARHGTAHAALISEILNLLAGSAWYGEAENFPVPGARWGVAPKGLTERLTDSETRVLRYLPTNLAAPEIARELSVSVNTVRTHMRHLYEKLGAHSRTEAVERARVLRLLAPSLPRLNNKTVIGRREPGGASPRSPVSAQRTWHQGIKLDRSWRLRIFPFGLRGSAGMKETEVGLL